ncbi:hypothetical protein ONZ45_g1349 [Pleurotus djamor]|nr:hypothetical protein ONZ45_g1349 [Pleurotus djamor]
MYVQQLASVKQEALSKAEVKLVVIGCGEWQAIKPYAEITGFQGDVYANPTRDVYRALGMTIETLQATPSGATKRSYITEGRFSNIYTSISRAFRNPSMIGKQGNISQLGGDFVLGPGLQCSFTSRMQNTEDHVEVAELMKAAGVEYQ